MKKILGIPLGNHATSYHRIIQPLYTLLQDGYSVQFLGEESQQLAQYKEADIIYIQALYTPDAYEFYRDQVKLGKKLIIDFDDDYFNIPEDSPEQTYVITKTGENILFSKEKRIHWVKAFLRLADTVVVTTPVLKELYEPYSQKIIIIPNYVSEDMCRDIPKTENEKVRVLWSGSASHQPDLALLEGPFAQLLSSNLPLEIHCQGPLDFAKIFKSDKVISHPGTSFAEYLNTIQAINPDVAVCPLKENPFNLAKSNLKYLQMSLMEAAVVASDYGEYHNTITSEVDGILVKDSDSWIKQITYLVTNKDYRKALVQNALQKVKKEYMIENGKKRWKAILITS